MIENLIILDTETTGLDPSKGAKIIEVGAILYNVKHKTILQNFSTLFPTEENPAEEINGIKAEATKQSMPFELVNGQLKLMCEHAEALVAHNAEFDKKFLKTLSFWQHSAHIPFICTKNDFRWPLDLYRKRLKDICAVMGVPYMEAHRALNDCRLIAECFTRVDDLEARLEQALLKTNVNNGYAMTGNQYV